MVFENIIKVLEKTKGFDWNQGNIDKNFKKHQIKDKEAEETFFNLPFIVNFDEKHSTKSEKRFQALEKTNEEKKLFIVFTIRNNKIRIISARKQSQKERRQYQKYEKT